MQPRRLPLVESDQPHHVYVVIPGLEMDSLEGTEFQVNREQGILNVYCYTSGFDEEGNCEGIFFPVKLGEDDFQLVENIRTVEVLNPRELDPEHLGEEDYDRVREELESRGMPLADESGEGGSDDGP